jgi:hypothetical protein
MPSVRPPWAVKPIIVQVPAIQIADPSTRFLDTPSPLGSPTALSSRILSTLAPSLARRKTRLRHISTLTQPLTCTQDASQNSAQGWVLCHFMQSNKCHTTLKLLSRFPGAPFAAEKQQFVPYTLSWSIWDSYANFVDITFKSLNQRHFSAIHVFAMHSFPKSNIISTAPGPSLPIQHILKLLPKSQFVPGHLTSMPSSPPLLELFPHNLFNSSRKSGFGILA